MKSTDEYIISWRCWYNNGNGTVEYNSLSTTLDELPNDGFQAMRVWYSDGTGRFISGNDYYFFMDTPEGLLFGQSNDSIESIIDRYPSATIKRGKHIADREINRISNLMTESVNPIE